KTIAASFKQQRFGRLAAGSRNAAAGQPVALPLEAQYWDSTMSPPGFVLNTLDSCTPFASGNVGLGNYAGKLTAATASVGAGTFSVGRNSVTVTPGSANPGSVDLVFNLGTNIAFNSCLSLGATPPTPAGANLTHLRGQW